MARKSKGPEQPPIKEVESESTKVKQEIANLCTTVGDRSYVIRQATADIANFYSQIDALRTKLIALETPNGSQETK